MFPQFGVAPTGGAGEYPYQTLFMQFRPQQTPAGPQLVGQQIFSFFNTSGLPKPILANIWKEATYGQPGGLDLPKFVNAMKLISLAQTGQPPTMANLQQNPNVQPPKLQYPQGHEPGGGAAPAIGGGGGGGGGDQFGNLLSGFGLNKPATSGLAGLGNLTAAPTGPAKPAGPSWGPSDTGATPAAGPPPGPGAPMGNGISPLNPSGIVAPPSVRANTFVSGTDPTSKNQYGPPTSLLTRQSSLNILGKPGDSGTSSPQNEPRRGSGTSWTDERLREQVRAAELRESQARKQANEARIANERLERENEQLQREAREARDSQSSALKQSQEALAAITPLRTENEQLKVALGQWKVLVEQKDAAITQYEEQITAFNAQLKEAEQEFNLERGEFNDLKFQLENYKTRCDDSESRADTAERKVRQLTAEKNELELAKHEADLANIKLRREIEDLKRQVEELKHKPTESSLINFGPSPSKPAGPSFAPPSEDFSSFGPPSASGNKFSPPSSTSGNQFSPPPAAAAPSSGAFGPPGYSSPATKPAAPAAQPAPTSLVSASQAVASQQPTTASSSGGDLFGFDDFPSNPSPAPAQPSPAPVQPSPGPAQPSPAPVQQSPAPPMSFGPPEQKEPVVQPVVQPKPQPKPQPQPRPAAPAQPVEQPEPDYYATFALQQPERDQYVNFFSRADTTGRGKLNRQEAVAFCRQSGLPDPTLEKLWTLVNRNNEMTPDQFAVMFHMCLKIKVGGGSIPTPETLPKILLPFVEKGMKKQAPPKQDDFGFPSGGGGGFDDGFGFPSSQPTSAPTQPKPQPQAAPQQTAPTATPGGDDDWAEFQMDDNAFPDWN